MKSQPHFYASFVVGQQAGSSKKNAHMAFISAQEYFLSEQEAHVLCQRSSPDNHW